jgi:hypothetical protein
MSASTSYNRDCFRCGRLMFAGNCIQRADTDHWNAEGVTHRLCCRKTDA